MTLDKHGRIVFDPTITASGDFSETDNCLNAVNAGANCAIQVTFTPAQPGARTGH